MAPVLRPTTDGLVLIRPPRPGDAAILVAGRDEEFHRWLGPGSSDPQPTGCVVVDDEVVGWVDYDLERDWLSDGEVNVGYGLVPAHRGKGYASRALQLLMHHLAVSARHHTATLLIDAQNERSLAVGARTGFAPGGELDASRYFKRPAPPLSYTDGVVTIRRQEVEDLDADLEAKDDEQINWLWLPGQRESWESMTPDQQRAHALAGLQANHDAFGAGPKWTFAVDAVDGPRCVAYVDCDLANTDVLRGEANLSYSSHPAHRGKGYVSRAVRLVMRFLGEHTGAEEAHLIVDAENAASRRVAAAVDAPERERWIDRRGRPMIRHVLTV